MNKKHHNGVLIEKNAFVDQGEGMISFPNKLVITDNTEMRNGTRYDIDSMDISEYKGQLTADHEDLISNLIGSVKGVAKVGTQVVVDAIQFAVKENPLGRMAYNLIKGGFLTDFSIETYGPEYDENGVYHNARLIGLSAVVVGNHRNATINKIVTNSIEQSRKDGLDVSEVENSFLPKFKVSQNHVTENEGEVKEMKPEEQPAETPKPIEVKEPETPEPKEQVVEVQTPAATPEAPVVEEPKNNKENEMKPGDTPAPVTEPETPVAPVTPVPAAQSFDMAALGDMLTKTVNAALETRMKPLEDKITAVEQNAFDKGAAEPAFKKEENGFAPKDLRHSKNDFTSLPYQERHAMQIQSAWDMLKRHDYNAAQTLNNLNEVNLQFLKKEGKVNNAVTIADFGNFVISPELLTEIAGCRNNYTELINRTSWKETLSTQFAWLARSGDISMQPVEFCDDDANGNLKPISQYSATPKLANLEELAAVTPVCNAATRFLAVDLLNDVAAGYRNDYDRGRAQLVIARLEQAIEENGHSVIYDVNPAVGGLTAWIDTWAQIATCTPNGTYVFNTSTFAEVQKRAVESGANGPLANIFVQGGAALPTIFGRPFVVVPDDMMPTLNSAGTRTVVVDGTTVTINHAVFYADLNNFTGRTSGGLQYDLSTEAAYEENSVVKSAYQRNELVLRGSYFRGGAIMDTAQVAGLLSPGVS